MALAPNQIVGSYRIIRPLGQGGMGTVYEVEHTKLGVRYAMKTFSFHGGHNELLKNKFLAEGKVLARLHNPNLIRVFDMDFDEETGTLYFIMDLILSDDGQPHTLSDVKTADLDEDCIFHWFGELSAALDYIHDQGVVHRDIKLGNILLTADNKAILSDFGVSKFFSEKLRANVNAVVTMVSEVGSGNPLVMGTRGYLAPEVTRGEAATPVADSYSLGVMFVYLLTGLWYEPGSKVFKLLETMEYRWIDVLPRLLAENPKDRPSRLGELVGLLSDVPDDASAPSRESAGSPLEKSATAKASANGKWRIFAVISGAVIIGLASLCIYLLTRDRGQIQSQADEFDEAFSTQGIYGSPVK